MAFLMEMAPKGKNLLENRADNDNTKTYEFSSNKVTKIAAYSFAYDFALSRAKFPNATEAEYHAFDYSGIRKIESGDFPKLNVINSNMFSNCMLLETVDLPDVTKLDTSSFAMNGGIISKAKIKFPSTSVLTRVTINTDSSHIKATGSDSIPPTQIILGTTTDDSGNQVENLGPLYIAKGSFSSCKSLVSLVLKSNMIITLGTTAANIFGNSPIMTSTTTGYVYVPDNLLLTYQSAANWIAISTKIKKLSELPDTDPVVSTVEVSQ